VGAQDAKRSNLNVPILHRHDSVLRMGKCTSLQTRYLGRANRRFYKVEGGYSKRYSKTALNLLIRLVEWSVIL